MKYLFSHIALLITATLCLAASAQDTPSPNEAKAGQVVEDFYRVLNLEALQGDSLLFVESHIVPRGQTDTLIMRRWAGPRHRRRVELWFQDTLQMCLFSDGRTYFERYRNDEGWKSIHAEKYHDEVQAYDIYGPLYQWQLRGDDLTYEGTVTFHGQPVERIGVRNPQHYDRHYYFEKESKLMFLYTESDSIGGEPATIAPRNRVDWHAYHEYQPLGEALLPSVESYQHQGAITLLFHHARRVAFDDRIFTQRQLP